MGFSEKHKHPYVHGTPRLQTKALANEEYLKLQQYEGRFGLDFAQAARNIVGAHSSLTCN